MKTPALALFLVVLCSAVSAEAQSRQLTDATVARSTPRNGNELLDWCNHVVRALDAPAEAALDPSFTENMMKFGWCAGYLEGFRDMLIAVDTNLLFLAAAGVKCGPSASGPEEARELPVRMLMFSVDTCIPDGKVPAAQLARIVVKWLRDHPERLHELTGLLTLEAFTDAFPCQAPANKPDNQ